MGENFLGHFVSLLNEYVLPTTVKHLHLKQT